jgi:hypothetical protein
MRGYLNGVGYRVLTRIVEQLNGKTFPPALPEGGNVSPPDTHLAINFNVDITRVDELGVLEGVADELTKTILTMHRFMRRSGFGLTLRPWSCIEDPGSNVSLLLTTERDFVTISVWGWK